MNAILPTTLEDALYPDVCARTACEDEAALGRWLAVASHRNRNTFRSYLREARRWRLFLSLIHANNPARPTSTLLRDATERDVATYEAVLQGKAAPALWSRLLVPTEALVASGLTGQPFVLDNDGVLLPRALKRSSVSQAIAILHALYEFWLRPDAETRMAYVGANPVRRLKRASVRAQRQSDRVFPLTALHAMLTICEADRARAQTNIELQAAVRRRWILCLLFGLWARRAEIAALRMGDFRYDGRRWTVRLQRKGDKEQALPVAPWVMDALVAYRQSLGMSGLPAADDERAAILPLRPRSQKDNGAPLDPATIYREVTGLARRAADALVCGEMLPELSALDRERTVVALRALSPHWFRHTGASIAIESGAMSLENASRVLGHSSAVVTASMYYHPEEQQVADGLTRLGSMLTPQACGAASCSLNLTGAERTN